MDGKNDMSDTWKKATIIPNKSTTKSLNEVTNERSISLTSVVIKTMERMVCLSTT